MTKKSTMTLIIFACLVYAISAGIRSNYGILMDGLLTRTDLTYEQISFVMGIGQLSYGFAQPIFGYIAMKKSNRFVLTIGLILMIAGLILTPVSSSQLSLLISLGILLSAGTGILCFGIIMGLISPYVSHKRAATISGFLNASSGVGSSILSPVIEVAIRSIGVAYTMWSLAGMTFLLLPFAAFIFTHILKPIVSDLEPEGSEMSVDLSAGQKHSLKEVFSDRNYIYLMLGFATCGFHMAIIQTHFFSQMVSYGILESTAALAYTTFGIASMVGSILCGYLCSRFALKNVLAGLYGMRALIVAIFIYLLPKNVFAVYLFAIVLGMTGDATVTPTSEIINRRYGAAQLGFLFGLTYVSHQIGSFFSAWLGGIFVTGSGDYHTVWLLDIGFCLFAFVVSALIRKEKSTALNPVTT